MTTDEKEAAIAQYNRQRAKTRRSQSKVRIEEPDVDSSGIAPLVTEAPTRSRRSRQKTSAPIASSAVAFSAQSGDSIDANHPILKRKRVQRDLSQVIFGPTQ